MTDTQERPASKSKKMESPLLSEKKPVCFVIMPISDVLGYDAGHFKAVYEHTFKPACEAAGYEAVRADDVKATNMIQEDIIKKLYESEMVLCDLSTNNPNVLYELGFRQAFGKPVVLVKDDKTEYIFDASLFRAQSYMSSRKYEIVLKERNEIKNAILETKKIFEDKDFRFPSTILSKYASVPENIEFDSSVIMNILLSMKSKIDAIDSSSFTKNKDFEIEGYLDNRAEIYESFMLKDYAELEDIDFNEVVLQAENDFLWTGKIRDIQKRLKYRELLSFCINQLKAIRDRRMLGV